MSPRAISCVPRPGISSRTRLVNWIRRLKKASLQLPTVEFVTWHPKPRYKSRSSDAGAEQVETSGGFSNVQSKSLSAKHCAETPREQASGAVGSKDRSEGTVDGWSEGKSLGLDEYEGTSEGASDILESGPSGVGSIEPVLNSVDNNRGDPIRSFHEFAWLISST